MSEPETDNVIPVEEMQRRRHVAHTAESIAVYWKSIGEAISELHDLGVPHAEWVDLASRHLSQAAQDRLGDKGRKVVPIVIDLITRSFARPDGEGNTTADYADAVKAGMGLSDALDGPGIVAMLLAVLPDMVRSFFSRGDTVQLPPDEEPMTLEERQRFQNEMVKDSMAPEVRRIKNVIARLFAEAPTLDDATDQAPALECHIMLKCGGQIGGALSVTPEGTLRMLSLVQGKPTHRGEAPTVSAVEHFFDYDQVADIAVMRPISVENKSSIIT